MELILKICIVLLAGAIGGKITSHFKLPNVSGYLVAGLLLGPSFFNYLSSGDINSFTIISEFALGIIAFSIGNEFTIKEMSKLGRVHSNYNLCRSCRSCSYSIFHYVLFV